MTPEQRQAMLDQFARQGGQGGQTGRGGRGQGQGGNFQQGGGRGGRGAGVPVNTPPPYNPDADKIDEFWAPLVAVQTNGNVWTWDEAKKELKQHPLRLGVTDGTFTQLLSGDVQVGQAVITSVILPASMRQNAPANPLMQQQQRGGGGMPGMQPSFGGGGGRGGGGRGGN
jgi:hypothetical protein